MVERVSNEEEKELWEDIAVNNMSLEVSLDNTALKKKKIISLEGNRKDVHQMFLIWWKIRQPHIYVAIQRVWYST